MAFSRLNMTHPALQVLLRPYSLEFCYLLSVLTQMLWNLLLVILRFALHTEVAFFLEEETESRWHLEPYTLHNR